MHRAVEYVIDACEGLAEAHARGIIHQDVKPANLFVVTSDDGQRTVKLLDFGIATMRTKEENERDSKSSAPRSHGTPAYLSPEQLRGHAIDHRSDVWSLGCVLYEILSGERAFKATRFTELVTKILEAPPDPLPPSLDVPPALAQVIARCLEKDPQKRWSSTGELAIALLPFAKRRAHSSAAKAVAHVKTGGIDPQLKMPSTMPPPPPDATPAPIATPPPPPNGKLPVYIACAVGVVGLSAAAFALTRSAEPSPPSPPPSASVVAIPTAPPSGIAAPPSIAWSAGPSVESAAPPVPSATESAAPTVKNDPPRPRPSRPGPSAKPSASTPEAEIRLTR